jgi:hypothetical protein
MFVQKKSKGRGTQERQVPVENEDVVEPLPPLAGSSNGVPCAQLLSLPQRFDGGKGLQIVAYLLSPMTDKNGGSIGFAVQNGFEEIPQHRLVEDWEKNFGKVALHTGPLPCRHN